MTQEEMDEVDAFNARMEADPEFAASQLGMEARDAGLQTYDDNMDESIAETMAARPQVSSEMERYMNPFQQTFH